MSPLWDFRVFLRAIRILRLLLVYQHPGCGSVTTGEGETVAKELLSSAAYMILLHQGTGKNALTDRLTSTKP